MSFLRKRLVLIFAIVITMIVSFFVFVEVYEANNDSTNCLDSYTEKEINTSRELALKYIKDTSQINFPHPTLFYQDKSLTFWTGSDFPGLEKILFEKDTSFLHEENQSIYRIHSEKLPDNFRMITAIPLIRNGAFLTTSPFQPSCWYFHTGDNPVSPYYTLNSVQAFIPGIWIWLYILLSILLAIGFAYSTSYKMPFKIKHLNVRKGVPFFVALILLFVPTLISSFFAMHWLTKAIDTNSIRGINLLLLLTLFSGLFYFLAARRSRYFQNNDPVQKASTKIILTIGSYVLIAGGAIGLIFLIRFIHEQATIDFVLDQLYRISIKEISYLILYLLIIGSYFILAQRLYGIISQLNPKLWVKLSGIIVGLILLVLTFSFGSFQLDIMSLGLSFLILIVSLDLYQDKKSLNSTWTLTWMILMAAFLSLLVFQLDWRHDMDKRKVEISQILKERDGSLEKSLKGNGSKINTLNYDLYPVYPEDHWHLDWLKSMVQLEDDLYFSPFTGDYYHSFPADSTLHIIGEFYLTQKKLEEGEANWLLNEHYALLSNDTILYQHNLLSQPGPAPISMKQNYKMYTEQGQSIVIFSPNEDISLMHEKEYPGLLRPLSLFSLLFFILSILVFLLSLFNSWTPFLPETLEMKFFQKKSLRNRIQISIISLLIASFLVIGLVSQHYLQSMANESSIQTQMEHADKVKHRLSLLLSESRGQNIKNQLELLTRKALDLGEDQLVFYKSDGFVSNVNVFSKADKLIPDIIPYSVYQALNSDQSRKIYFEEKDSRKGVFFKLEQLNRTIFAFIPEQRSHYGSNRISDILATFLSIYTLLFILSGMIAIVLSNSITRPIELLGKKLRGLKLSKKNEPVQWKNEDEIGTLIGIYNEMIQKLSDNAKVMAKVERDSAWKEMAKQVAHEIKNPLTPLKLNIQYLEAKIRMSPEDAPDLITQITPGLIEQIDNLSQIASEFSNFAQLPSARNEKIRLNEIVKTVHDFFRKREDLKFQLFVPINDILVFADRNHLVRILNNVVKNAIQAIPPEREGEIILRLYTKDNDAIVQITDNGSGIPKEMQDKVFSPNFTTKSSGTGLGLAISMNMLESFNGRIYFETEENIGTDFFIEIPLMRLGDNYPESKKVVLDI